MYKTKSRVIKGNQCHRRKNTVDLANGTSKRRRWAIHVRYGRRNALYIVRADYVWCTCGANLLRCILHGESTHAMGTGYHVPKDLEVTDIQTARQDLDSVLRNASGHRPPLGLNKPWRGGLGEDSNWPTTNVQRWEPYRGFDCHGIHLWYPGYVLPVQPVSVTAIGHKDATEVEANQVDMHVWHMPSTWYYVHAGQPG